MKPGPLLGGLLLAGCGVAPAAPEACRLAKLAEIPVILDHGFVSVAAAIDGEPVTLLVDTGSESSLVTPAAMARLALPADPRRSSAIQGIGGTIITQNAALRSLAIGRMQLLDRSAAVASLPTPPGEPLQEAGLQAAGLLGADWLSAFDVEFDLPHRRMALYHAPGCGGDDVPWQGPRASVVASVSQAGVVVLPMAVDGRPVAALLDTGSNLSTLGEAAAARAGLDAAALAGDPAGQSVGVDGAVNPTHHHQFAELRLGPIRYVAPVLSVSGLRWPGADMLLGTDWLRQNRVWVSYGARRVTVQPAGAE